MKRLHVHVAVQDLDASIRFYSHLFAADPVVLKSDYARWMLDDPRVNFAISSHREDTPVFNHGTAVVPVEATSGPCCVPQQQAKPAASCCAPTCCAPREG